VLNREAWRFQRRALAGTATLIRYDQRGHGGSAPGAAGSLTVPRLGDDLAAVLDRTVPPHLPVVVAGHAMGSVAIMSLAARRPELFGDRIVGAALLSPSCGRLVLDAPLPERWRAAAHPEESSGERPGRLAPVIPLPARPDGFPRYGPAGHTGSRTRACAIPETHVAASAPRGVSHARLAAGRSADYRCTGPGARAKRDHIRFVTERVEATPTEAMPGYAHELLVREDPAILAALRRTETMIMVGSDDRITPPVHGRRLADLLPEAVLTVVAGAGHLIALERPDVVNRALRGFLLDCRARAGR